MKSLILAGILLASILGHSQNAKQDTLTGNYYPVTKPKLLKMNVDDRGLISCVLKNPNGEERAMDFMIFSEFNKLFDLEYTGNSYISNGEKYPVYKTKTGKLFILRVSEKTDLVYRLYLSIKP